MFFQFLGLDDLMSANVLCFVDIDSSVTPSYLMCISTTDVGFKPFIPGSSFRVDALRIMIVVPWIQSFYVIP